jgi:hypothetical protein
MEENTFEKLFVLDSNPSFMDRIKVVLTEEKFSFETIDINKLVCDIRKYSSNLVLMPAILSEIIDKCVNDGSKSYRLNVILMTDDMNKKWEKKKYSALNVVDSIYFPSDSYKLKETIQRYYKAQKENG